MPNPNNKYAVAAKVALEEVGGGPLRSKQLFDLMVEKGMIPNEKNVYNYVLKACKESPDFDTSARGRIGLAKPQDDVVAAPAVYVEEVAEYVEDEQVEQ